MKKPLPTLLILILCTAIPVFAQENAAKRYALRGDIRDQQSRVIVGLRLSINNGSSSLTDITDIDGQFQFTLSDGDYVLTADELTHDKFRAFIKITDMGLNPNYLEFVIDSSAIICSGNSGKSSPKLISSEQPTYPPAARAIRAWGEVTVELTIAQNGDVVIAKAISGHPLLRAVSVAAAKNFKFESSESADQRKLQFIFLYTYSGKETLIRYQCPYRMNVVLETLPVDVTNTQTR